MTMAANSLEIQTVLDFLKSNSLAVISTVDTSSEKPESALVAFAELNTFELIFETYRYTRKYENIMKNKHVAFVIGWDLKKHITLQYEGLAHLLKEEEIEVYTKIFLKKDTPCTEKFLFHLDATLFKVSPIWIRYSDYSIEPPQIIDLHF
jgi:uncharacterized pyridoxamine 5'-phosphate oxidase family protein